MKKLSCMNCNTYICFVKFYKNASETPYNPLMSLTVTYILGFLIGPKCKKKIHLLILFLVFLLLVNRFILLLSTGFLCWLLLNTFVFNVRLNDSFLLLFVFLGHLSCPSNCLNCQFSIPVINLKP